MASDINQISPYTGWEVPIFSRSPDPARPPQQVIFFLAGLLFADTLLDSVGIIHAADFGVVACPGDEGHTKGRYVFPVSPLPDGFEAHEILKTECYGTIFAIVNDLKLRPSMYGKSYYRMIEHGGFGRWENVSKMGDFPGRLAGFD